MIEDKIFKKARANFKKLEKSAFIKIGDDFEIEKSFMDKAFRCIIKIDKEGKVRGKVFDNQTGEEYLPFRMEHLTGGFSSKVRDEYEKILADIFEKYFIENYFISPQANRITDLIHKKYSILPDFPWRGQKTASDAGVFRKTPGGKWFAALLNIKKDRLIKKADGEFDILNLKLDEAEIQTLVEKEGFYPAYHMNKKYWITLILDETLNDDEIMIFVNKSFNNVK